MRLSCASTASERDNARSNAKRFDSGAARVTAYRAIWDNARSGRNGFNDSHNNVNARKRISGNSAIRRRLSDSWRRSTSRALSRPGRQYIVDRGACRACIRDVVMIERIYCNECGSRVRNNFRAKWRHMVEKHPEHVAARILPMVFLPAEELRQIGVDLAHSFIRKLKNG